jgi:hypothetical protein
VLGGNKSLLFNAEYMISIAGPVRLVLFYDAGQVRDIGEKFGWRRTSSKWCRRPRRCCSIRSARASDRPERAAADGPERSAFKTSTRAPRSASSCRSERPFRHFRDEPAARRHLQNASGPRVPVPLRGGLDVLGLQGCR